MTYPDDFLRLHLSILGTVLWTLRECGLAWPPPERLVLNDRFGQSPTEPRVRTPEMGDPVDAILVRVSLSAITDAQRAEMTRVCRGAEYVYAPTN